LTRLAPVVTQIALQDRFANTENVTHLAIMVLLLANFARVDLNNASKIGFVMQLISNAYISAHVKNVTITVKMWIQPTDAIRVNVTYISTAISVNTLITNQSKK
jgi:hypothetical protein